MRPPSVILTHRDTRSVKEAKVTFQRLKIGALALMFLIPHSSPACSFCGSTTDVCISYDQVCDSYSEQCTSYQEVCTSEEQVCDSYSDVCTAYDDNGDC